MNKTGPTNVHLRMLITDARKLKSKFWISVADELSRSARIRRTVNLSRINRCTKAGESVIVPGKVLSAGKLDHKLTISAWQFSDAAKAKIAGSGGKTITINQLMKDNSKGEGVKILG